MRYLYSTLLYLISPLIALYLSKRAKKNPQYQLFWHERFGIKLKHAIPKPIIWLHAVSVGETRAMAKLIELIETSYPNYQLLITQMTPTGRETARSLFPKAELHYLPYDFPHAVINFYNTYKPKLGLIMETEIWPNLIFYANKFKIPLYLVNARLSTKSFTSYEKIKYLIAPILNKFTGILCQDQATYDNFIKLGYKQAIQVIGSIKFDIIANAEQAELAVRLKQKIAGKKIVAFASTRDGEERLILDTLPNHLDYVIILIPRHPERFTEVEQLLIHNGVSYQKRSDNKPITETTQVLLGDSLGEMFTYFQMADLAVIGGSFSNQGGQNLIEPLQLNKPVIFGPSMYNFATIAKNALANNCAVQVNNMAECFIRINELFENKELYLKLVKNCQLFIMQYQGASQKIIDTIDQHL
jgi:3-deoxy-D-manno-octulosonic-acid transferase